MLVGFLAQESDCWKEEYQEAGQFEVPYLWEYVS